MAIGFVQNRLTQTSISTVTQADDDFTQNQVYAPLEANAGVHSGFCLKIRELKVEKDGLIWKVV